jgi:hypothetical protein
MVRITAAQKTSVDARENVLELAEGVASVGLDAGEVDVKVRVVRKVWFATVDDGLGDVESKIGIYLAV